MEYSLDSLLGLFANPRTRGGKMCKYSRLYIREKKKKKGGGCPEKRQSGRNKVPPDHRVLKKCSAPFPRFGNFAIFEQGQGSG